MSGRFDDARTPSCSEAPSYGDRKAPVIGSIDNIHRQSSTISFFRSRFVFARSSLLASWMLVECYSAILFSHCCSIVGDKPYNAYCTVGSNKYILYILSKKTAFQQCQQYCFLALFYCRLSTVLPTHVTVETAVSINTGIYVPSNNMIEQATSLQL